MFILKEFLTPGPHGCQPGGDGRAWRMRRPAKAGTLGDWGSDRALLGGRVGGGRSSIVPSGLTRAPAMRNSRRPAKKEDLTLAQTPASGIPEARPTSNNALISLIAGILGVSLFPLIGSIIAVIVGGMARKEIAASGGALGGEGLATAGIILGWVGIALAAAGLCIGGFFIALPFCLALFAISTEGFSVLAGMLLF
jgi:hypothetical protein